MEKLQKIVYLTRQTGNTTWILKSAIKNPECVIVSKNVQQAKRIEHQYYQMLLDAWWGQKLWWKWFGRKHPRFLSLQSEFKGFRLPVIFDNGALLKIE